MGKIAHDSTHTLLTSLASKFIIGFLIDICISRALGIEGKGQYALVLNTFNGLSLLFGFGIQNQHAVKTANGSLSLSAALLNSLIFAGVSTAVSLALIGVFFLFGSETFLLPFNSQSPLFWGLIAVLPLFFASSFFTGIILGKGDIPFVNYITLIGQGGMLIIIGGLFLTERLTPSRAIFCYFISIAIPFLMAVSYFRRDFSLALNTALPSGFFMSFFSSAIVVQFTQIAFFFYLRNDQYLVNALLGEGALGIYATAARFAEIVWIIADSTGSSLLVYAASVSEERESVTFRLSIIILGISVILGGCIVIFGWLVIPFIYTDVFSPSLVPLAIMAPGAVMYSFVRVYGTYFVSIERAGLHLGITLIAFALSVGLNAVLIPSYGVSGAAISYCIAGIFYGLCELCFFFLISKKSPRYFLSESRKIKSDITRLLSHYLPPSRSV